MKNPLEQLTNRPFSEAGPFTLLFLAAGIHDFAGAASHVRALPYGRIGDRKKLWLVLEEGRGTCTTKHALLAELAREQGIEVRLTLGIYEMSERNTPGVGQVLGAYGLEYIPEAHCYLRHESGRIDVTGVPAGAAPIDYFLHEEPITVDQIGAYKQDLHRRFLRDWITRTDSMRGRSLKEVWRIREACIAALGVAECSAAQTRVLE
jgi:Transglutaminase-like superfamily